jgi:hypothetical protein
MTAVGGQRGVEGVVYGLEDGVGDAGSRKGYAVGHSQGATAVYVVLRSGNGGVGGIEQTLP